MNEIILSTQNGEPVASSREVAKRFGKEHKHVLAAIRQILAAENSATKFFHETAFEYRGQRFPEYLMNRDGFTLLAMGFTGKEAVTWKLKYIEAFNQMEKQLAAQHKEQQAVQDANIQSAIDRVIEARKKLDKNTAFLDECRKSREDSKAKYMKVRALCGEFKAIYGQHCDTVRTMENVVRGSQSFLTNAIDSLTIVAKGYPFYAALMDSVYQAAQALTRLYQPDKINYLVFGDTGTHLHVHIVPKYQGGKDWGKVFLTDEPSPVYLTEPEYQNSVAALRRQLALV